MFIFVSILFVLSLLFFVFYYPNYKFQLFTIRKIIFVLLVLGYMYICTDLIKANALYTLYVVLFYIISNIIIFIVHKVLKNKSGATTKE